MLCYKVSLNGDSTAEGKGDIFNTPISSSS